MLLIAPTVVLGTHTLTSVTHLAIDRVARRAAVEWTDMGPHAAFADVPEQRVGVVIVRHVLASETTGPRPGDALTLTARAATNNSAAATLTINATLVITAVEHHIAASGRATQTIRATAVSTSGAADPITESINQGEL